MYQHVQCQTIESDTVSAGSTWIPTHVRIGTDIISWGKSGLSDFTEQWEFETEIDINKFYLVFDYGRHNYRVNQDSTARSQYLRYLSSGSYWRLGIDANLISYDRFGGVLFLGLRYASSNFSEQMSGASNVDGWGLYNFYNENPQVRATWLEIVTGIKARVWKGLTMGYTLRLKINPQIKGAEEIETYWVPGYGLGSENSFWAMSYYIYWTFDFRKKYLPARNR